ncbi:MAG TPA: DUF2403 domain-containing protein [Polyangiaceae bacterium]|nr:DUF2403 domain-containing protein [Polyangiaceae bacterium]
MRAKPCLVPAGIVAVLSLYGLGCSTDSGAGPSSTSAGDGAVNPGAGNGPTQPGGGNGSAQGGVGSVQGGATNNPNGGAQVGTSGTTGNAGAPPASGGSGPAGPSVGAAQFGDGDLDAVSDGGTLTFQSLGKAGFYPSRRDPASGMCDVYQNGTCCMTKHQLTDDKLTPWNEELIVTLRGPIQLKQFVVYTEAEDGMKWDVQSAWDSKDPTTAFGIAFDGNATKGAKFAGTVGSECVADAMTDKAFPCGPNSVPYCPAGGGGPKNYGWSGSKLFVMTARMPMMGGAKLDAATACGTGTSNGWYNAPWIGISLGELVREGKFGDCNCYGKTPPEWYAGDGCGQINAFEVVNDNNDYQNFDVFSSNIFAYYGNVGEGPCGKNCNLTGVGPADLIDKATSKPAAKGGVTTFGGSAAHVAFRRPTEGYRYVLALFDVNTRTMQLAIIHPSKVPAAAAGLLPTLPKTLDRATIDALLAMRLPQ